MTGRPSARPHSVEVVPVSSRSVCNTKSNAGLNRLLNPFCKARDQCHTIRQMSQSESMDRVWMEDVFKFDSFRFRAAHHHFGLFCQQEKENSPAVCIGLTPGGAHRLPWFRKEFRLFSSSFF